MKDKILCLLDSAWGTPVSQLSCREDMGDRVGSARLFPAFPSPRIICFYIGLSMNFLILLSALIIPFYGFIYIYYLQELI